MRTVTRRGWWNWAVGLAVVGLALGVWGVLPRSSAVAAEGGGEPTEQEELAIELVYVPRIIATDAEGDIPFYFSFISEGEELSGEDVEVISAYARLYLVGTTFTRGSYSAEENMRAGDCVSGDGNDNPNLETLEYTLFAPMADFRNILCPIPDTRRIYNPGAGEGKCRFQLQVTYEYEGCQETQNTNWVEFSAFADSRVEAVNLGCPTGAGYTEHRELVGLKKQETFQDRHSKDPDVNTGDFNHVLYENPPSQWGYAYFDPEQEQIQYDECLINNTSWSSRDIVGGYYGSIHLIDSFHGPFDDESGVGPLMGGFQHGELGVYTIAYYGTKPNFDTPAMETFGGSERQAVIDVRQFTGRVRWILLSGATADLNLLQEGDATVDWEVFVPAVFGVGAGVLGTLTTGGLGAAAAWMGVCSGLGGVYASIGPKPDTQIGGDVHVFAISQSIHRDGTEYPPCFAVLGDKGKQKYIFSGPEDEEMSCQCDTEWVNMVGGETFRACLVFGLHAYDTSAGILGDTEVWYEFHLFVPTGEPGHTAVLYSNAYSPGAPQYHRNTGI